jgi:hypothetical protein
MVNRTLVQKALNQTWNSVNYSRFRTGETADNQSGIISQLIYDVFGGEILKTHYKKGWHFYNRVDGKRIDFSISEIEESHPDNHLDDLLSTPEETHNYFTQEDYSTFYTRFINAFEEVIGLKRYRHRTTV